MKKAVLVPLLLCSIFLMPGCWNRVEIEDRAIVAALGFDKAAEQGKMAVTAQIIKPGEIRPGGGGNDGSGGEAVVVYNGTGYNMFDAVRDMARETGRKLYFSEMQVIIIGEDLARESIGSVMDFIARDAEPELRPWVLVTGGTAREVLETPMPIEKVWGFSLRNMIRATKAHSKAPTVDVLNFLRAVESTTTCPVATGIELTGMERDPAKEAVAPGKKPVLGSTAVFHEYKMTGWLDETQTRGLLWVKGEIEGGIIVVPAPDDESKRKGDTPQLMGIPLGSRNVPNVLALEIIRADSEIKPEISDGRITITVKVTEEGNIGAVKPDHVEITEPEVIEAIEAGKKEAIENEIRAAVARARELNADVFGFGEAVRRKYPREWPQYEKLWDELFPALDVIVEVDAKIRRTGLITNPIKPGAQ